VVLTKVALKIAYIGTNFSGSQSQPVRRTVEGELKKSLVGLGAIGDGAKLGFSGRTDAGVHALGQVVAFKPLNEKLAEPRVINSMLPDDLWAYAKADVPDDFDPRRDATGRAYRYILYAPEVVEERAIEGSKLFIGKHDFSNFATIESNKSPIRTVSTIDISKHGDLYFIDISADSFLWNMVRKIVTGLTIVGSGERDLEWLERLLKPDEYREGIPPAPALGLYLMRVDYAGIEFVNEKYSMDRAYRRLSDSFRSQYTMVEIYRAFKDSMRIE
jgi:tRNA pseudouridine38-40 synthase